MPTALSTDLYQLTMMAGYFASGVHDRRRSSCTCETCRAPLVPRGGRPRAGARLPRDPLVHAATRSSTCAACRCSCRCAARVLRRVPAVVPLHGRRVGGAGGHAALRPRADAPGDRADYRGAAGGDGAAGHRSASRRRSRARRRGSSRRRPGRPVIEFGSRRAHGTEAAVPALPGRPTSAGCAGHVERRGRPSLRHPGLRDDGALVGDVVRGRGWRRSRASTTLYGDRSMLLIDTYDTLAAAPKLAASGLRPGWVRLDSGDIGRTQPAGAGDPRRRRPRRHAHLRQRRPRRAQDRRARLGSARRIDGFGVGTSLSTSKDAPALGAIYKLVELDRDGALRRHHEAEPGEGVVPGREAGVAHRSSATSWRLAGSRLRPAGRPLLRRCMTAGAADEPAPPLAGASRGVPGRPWRRCPTACAGSTVRSRTPWSILRRSAASRDRVPGVGRTGRRLPTADRAAGRRAAARYTEGSERGRAAPRPGSCAMPACEPRQGRKAAALSSVCHVPQGHPGRGGAGRALLV